MMVAAQIIALFAVTLLMLLLALTPAIVEWVTKTDANPLRVVREQDTSIRHFALSFRTQINTLFDEHQIDTHAPPGPFDTVWHGDEPVSFLGKNPYPEFTPDEVKSRRVNRVLVAAGDLLLPGDMVYEEEVYSCGSLTTGDRTAYRALYAERAITLGDESVIVRWMHCDGELIVGDRSQLLGRMSADRSVTIGRECVFERVSAPLIRFANKHPTPRARNLNDATTQWQIPEGVQTIDEQTLKAHRSLSLDSAVYLEKNLIVNQELDIAENVKIKGDVKAHARLRVGADSIIVGSLICEGSIEIGPGCLIKGPVVSESSIEIATGCIIGAPSQPTTVSAPRVAVAVGAQISGSLWAGESGNVEA